MEIELAEDFREFLALLKKHQVKYLLIGGYAVAFHGYPRFTGDLDIWIQPEPENARRVVEVLHEFGITTGVSEDLFRADSQMVRLGERPLRLDLTTSISGVDFSSCYGRRVTSIWDDVEVDLISLSDLRINKRASGRTKDLADLEYLPED